MRQGTALVELPVHMQQDAIDGVHSHRQGWSGWMNAELPIAIGPNAPEPVRDGRQRVAGRRLPSVIEVFAR